MAVEAEAHHNRLLPADAVTARANKGVMASTQLISQSYIVNGRVDDLAPPSCGAVGPPCTPFCVPAMSTRNQIPFTFADATAAASSRKRARVEEANVDEQFLGAAAKRPVLDVRPVVLRHVEKMAAEHDQWLRRYAFHAMSVAKAALARRLHAKDEEIERARRLGSALHERLRAGLAEAQAWRDAALRADAAAAVLRADLDHALLARARAAARAAEDDAESCCGGVGVECDDLVEEEDARPSDAGIRCRGCGERATAAAVFLPCRHLSASACAPCAAAARACPACGCLKSGSITVNRQLV